MLIIYLLLPAIVGVYEYGLFSYALSLCFIFSQAFIEFGLDPVITKHISRGSDHIIKDGFILRGKTSVIGFAVLLISATVLNARLDLVVILFLYVLFFSFSNMAFAYLRGKGRFIYESLMMPFFRASIIILILIFSKVFLIKNSYTGAIPFTVSSFLLFLSTMLILNRIYHIKNNDPQKKENNIDINLIREGSFLFFSTILWMIYFRIDSVMLGYIIGEEEVGVYSLSYRLYEGSIFLASSIMIVVFPKISSYGYDDLKRVFKRGIILLSGMSIIAFSSIFFIGELIIEKFYSTAYSQSITVLKILSFSTLAVFPAHITTLLLVARDKNHLFLLITAFGALLNIILNLILIPDMKSIGAALSTVITEVVILILSFVLSICIIKRKL